MVKSVKDYLRELAGVYQAAAAAVADDVDKLTVLREQKKEILKSGKYTGEGKRAAFAEIDEQIKAIDADVYSKRAEANKKAQEIRSTVDQMFYGYYHASPEDVDLKMIKLMESGILSDDELLHMAEKANSTMKRLIGRALENSAEGKYTNEGRRMQIATSNPHLKAIDDMIVVGDYACGGAKLSGADAASAFLKRWDELTGPIIAAAPDVSWSMEAFKPGEISYTTSTSE